MVTAYEYRPAYVTPPGNTLRDELAARSMSQTELAVSLGMAKQTISKIINGKAPISEDTAIGLARVLGVPAYYWLTHEANYRAYLQEKDQREKLAQHVDWVERFPYKAMAALAWVADAPKPVDRLINLLGFLGIKSPNEWQPLIEQKRYTSYRKTASTQADEYALYVWLIKGERDSQEQRIKRFSARVLRESLPALRKLTTEPLEVIRSELTRLCAESGVLLTFVPSLPMLGIWGAARWLSAERPLIQLSGRYRSDDHFWFTFFHEVYHILLHHNRTILEFGEVGFGKTEMEHEANEKASQLLIPDDQYWPFYERRERITRDRLLAFATELGIAPGIIVGRLQRDKRLHYNSRLNSLKRDFSALFRAAA